MRRRHVAPLRTSLLCTLPILAALAACSDPESGTRTPTELTPRMGRGGGTAKISVTVSRSDGKTAAAGLLALPFHQTAGPFKADGSFAGQLLDSKGSATFDGLVPGGYCVVVRALTTNDVARLVPPPVTPSISSSADIVGGVTNGKSSSEPLTPASFEQNCVTSPAVDVSGSANLKFSLPAAPGATVAWDIRDLKGVQVRPAAWTVVPLGFTPTWQPSGLAPDVRPGLLLGTTGPGSSQAGGIFGQSVIVQTELFTPSNDATEGKVTATVHRTAGSSTADDEVVYAIPLVCVVEKSFESFGDTNARIDFGGFGADRGVVKAGFGADGSLALVPDALALWYRQIGAGTATLNLRFVGGAVSNLQVDYECFADGHCAVGAQRGAGAGLLDVNVFGAADENEPDTPTRVSWVIRGLPAGTSAVDLQLQSTGNEAWPDASRNNQVSGYYRLSLPTRACDAGAGSDDRFWLN